MRVARVGEVAMTKRKLPPRPQWFPGPPGLQWRPRTDYWVAYWVASAEAVQAGYPVKTARLWPPSDGVRRTKLGLADWNYLRDECERLQSDCDNWMRKDPQKLPEYIPGLESLLEHYTTDPEGACTKVRQ